MGLLASVYSSFKYSKLEFSPEHLLWASHSVPVFTWLSDNTSLPGIKFWLHHFLAVTLSMELNFSVPPIFLSVNKGNNVLHRVAVWIK